ncbi:zinc finger protein 808-like [Odontomachus brunneus]|uniref:zinc finger protein 808-like n=1 Tax=Odontomachus brunneus TaxID=486640 RepID=UPI0013F24D37|nr:zinc finger protein 808-like [Odontomachus brunneus]
MENMFEIIEDIILREKLNAHAKNVDELSCGSYDSVLPRESIQNISISKNSNTSVTDRPEAYDVNSEMIASMEQKNSWPCTACGKIFMYKISLLKHISLNKCLQCKICNQNFDVLEEFKRHGWTCRRRLTCRKCSFKASTLKDMSEHMKSVHNTIDVKPIPCDICLKNFATQSNLKRHKETVHVDTLLKCPACGRSFQRKVSFEKHINLNNCLQCQICDQNFDVLEKFIRHYTMCFKSEYNCRECSYKTYTKNCLIKHMKSVHYGIDVLPIFCDICFTSFSTQRSLVRHKETVHVDTLMKCPACGRKFRSKVFFKKHINLNNCLQCQICDQKFDVLEKFIRHYTMCLKSEYTCRECPYKTHTKNCLIKHMKSVHYGTDVLPIFCDICFTSFSTQSNLMVHKERVHVSTLMKCLACSRKFRSNVSFKKHINLNNCLQCQICDQNFDVLEKFIRHYTMCLKPEYTCRECSYKTHTKNCLIKHMESVHYGTDVLPIFCDICFTSFSTQSNLMVHKERVHVSTLMKCLACSRKFRSNVSFKKHINLNNCLQCQICDQNFDVLEKFIRHYTMCLKPEYTCRECSYKTHTKNCLIKHMESVHYGTDVLPIFCDICCMSFATQHNLKRHKETVHV